MESIKESLQNFIDRLGRENQELFGGQTPDCCTLNSRKTPPKHAPKEESSSGETGTS
jgi:hypothetical protein